MFFYTETGKFNVTFPGDRKLEAIKFVRAGTGSLITAKSVVEGKLDTTCNRYIIPVDYKPEPTPEYQFAVAGQNIVLGIFRTMDMAIESLKQTVDVMKPKQETDMHSEFLCEYRQPWEVRDVNGRYICTQHYKVEGTFTITAVKPSTTVVGPLFKL